MTRSCMLESPMVTREQPLTVGALRSAVERGLPRYPTVKDELRTNLIAKLQSGEPLFPGIIGYDDTVVPQLVNALLSKHNFILLGLRGQAKTRILRSLVDLLDHGHPGRARLRDPRRSARAALLRVPRARGRRGRRPAGRRGSRARSATSRSWRRPT